MTSTGFLGDFRTVKLKCAQPYSARSTSDGTPQDDDTSHNDGLSTEVEVVLVDSSATNSTAITVRQIFPCEVPGPMCAGNHTAMVALWIPRSDQEWLFCFVSNGRSLPYRRFSHTDNAFKYVPCNVRNPVERYAPSLLH